MAGEVSAPAGEPAPSSPSFSIPAVKVASRRPTIDLQAWAALPESPNAAGSGAGAHSHATTSTNGEPAVPAAPLPIWAHAFRW